MPVPANDLCANATVIASLPHSETGLNNTDATTTAGENVVVAGTGTLAGAAQLYRSMWWQYTPGSNQRVKFASNNNNHAIGVFTGACGSLVEVASWGPMVTLDLTAGTTYKIGVGSYSNAGFAFNFSAAVSTAPGNQLQSTAKDLTGLLPFTATVDLATATDNTPAQVYYKYTPVAGELMLGFFAYASSFGCGVRVYDTPYNIYDANVAAIDVSATNVPIQYPLVAGQTYIIRVFRVSGTAGSCAISARMGPTEAISHGAILDPDDTLGFPGSVVSRDTGEVLAHVELVEAEWGDQLDDGTILLDKKSDASLHLLDASFEEILSIAALGVTNSSQVIIRMSPGLQQFFAGYLGSGATDATVHQIAADGTVLDSWTLPDAGLTAMAPNNDGSIVYVAGQVSSANAPVKRWNTDGAGSFGSNLIAGQGANWIATDILVLSDDSIIIVWLNTVAVFQAVVKRIASDGTVLGTYTKNDRRDFARLAYDADDRTTDFWLWTHDIDGLSTFERIRAASMTVVETVPLVRDFESGVYVGAETATPDAFFGISQSCPFIVLRIESEAVPGTIGPYVWVHWPQP